MFYYDNGYFITILDIKLWYWIFYYDTRY